MLEELVSGAQSLTTTVSADSILVRYDFTNTCSQVLQASVTGLPPGVTYIVQEVNSSLAYVQLRGIPTSVGNFNYTINVDNSLIATASAPACAATASTTITGSISVVASSTAASSCTQASISLVSGNPNQNITLGNAIDNVTWGLSTDCPPDGNGVPLNSSASGLPPGVIYSFSGQSQQIFLSGTPSSVGTYSYNIVYYNAQQLSNSSVVASITGTIGISSAASSTNSTQSWSINVTAQNSSDYQLSGNDRNGTVTGNDPTVTIALGDTLNFNVDAAGHPFYLKTQAGTGTANQVSGATNQGTENGIVTWTPNATGTYYYICSLHGGMSGTIIVQ